MRKGQNTKDWYSVPATATTITTVAYSNKKKLNGVKEEKERRSRNETFLVLNDYYKKKKWIAIGKSS